jgi:TRAP-type C4-dicarboxylate transport system permease small subunit
MQRRNEQRKPLYPQSIQWRKGIAITLGLACMMFSYAVYIGLNKIDPCIGGSDKWCRLADFWTQITGIPRYLADAQLWAALGLMMVFVAYQLWRNRANT